MGGTAGGMSAGTRPRQRKFAGNTPCFYVKLQQPHSSGDVDAKDAAKKAGKKELRNFNNEYILHSRYVTDAQRKDIGCAVHDATQTTTPRPSCRPEADVVYSGQHLLELVKIRCVPDIGNDPPGRGLRGAHLLGRHGGTSGEGQVPHFRAACRRRRSAPFHLYAPQEVPLRF